MKNTCKFCWGLSAFLVVTLAASAYMFVIRGNVTASDDGRMAIILPAGERDLVLAEMRGFLESLQAITEGLAEKDMVAIYASAHEVGMINAQAVPASLMSKLPLDFKNLGMKTHQAFDGVAMEAKDMGDEHIILTKVSEIMLNCTACHAAFRLEAEKNGEK